MKRSKIERKRKNIDLSTPVGKTVQEKISNDDKLNSMSHQENYLQIETEENQIKLCEKETASSEIDHLLANNTTSKSIAKPFKSKLKLPKRVSLLTLSPKKKSESKLSQIEKQNNLFIRDVKEPKRPTHGILKKSTDYSKVTHIDDKIKKSDIVKKSSLIPSFLSGNSKTNLTKKVDKPATSTTEKPTICIPARRPLPPPYREPPKPPKKYESNFNKNRFFPNKETKFHRTDKNYEEIDVIEEENETEIYNNGSLNIVKSNNVNLKSKENISEYSTLNTKAIIHTENIEKFSDEPISTENLTATENLNDTLLAKLTKGIPIRPRKGTASHYMDNYCLFDPTVDFCKENEIKVGNQFLTIPSSSSTSSVMPPFIPPPMISCDYQLVYDVLPVTSDSESHNYYVIDPDLLAEDEIMQQTKNEKLEIKKSKTFTNDSSSSSNSTSQTSTKSSTTTSDCQSLFNSVIETHSSTLGSTTDDSSGYGKVCVRKTEILKVQNSLEASTKPQGLKAVANHKANLAHQPKFKPLEKIRYELGKQQTKNSSFNYGRKYGVESLKASHSLPQLQDITFNSHSKLLSKTEYNLMMENFTTVQLRKHFLARQVRPLSNHSDADSGFLSPVTPDGGHSHNVMIDSNPSSSKTSSQLSLLNQCDGIQELIEVSHNTFIISTSGTVFLIV